MRQTILTAVFGPSLEDTPEQPSSTSGSGEGEEGGNTPKSTAQPPPASLGMSARDRAPTRHFRRVVQFLTSLEFFLLFGVIVLIETTLSTMLLPLKFLLAPGRVTRRDAFSLVLVAAGLCGFLIPTEAMLYSYFYHFIRASSMLKLYVIFNMLEVAEKLLTSLVSDACEAVANTLRPRSTDGAPFGLAMLLVACVGVSAHSLVLLLHVITINVAINSEGNSLLALLVSNNFMEVKSVVFKRVTVESLFQVAIGDVVERFQYVIFILVMLGQHARSEGFGTVEPLEIFLIFGCEIFIDVVKHLFVSRNNGIHLASYDYFSHILMLDVARERFLGSVNVPVLTTPYAASQMSKNGVLRAPYPRPYQHVTRDGVSVPCTLHIVGTTMDMASHEKHAFVPQPARRAAFAPFAYVALLIWQFSPTLWHFVQNDHISLALFLACLVAGKALSAALVGGLSLRFACRSMLRDEFKLLGGRAPPASSASGNAPVATTGGPSSPNSVGAPFHARTMSSSTPPMMSPTGGSLLPPPTATISQLQLSQAASLNGSGKQVSTTSAAVGGRRAAAAPPPLPASLLTTPRSVWPAPSASHSGSISDADDGADDEAGPPPPPVELFGVSPVGVGVSVPVATPQVLRAQAVSAAHRTRADAAASSAVSTGGTAVNAAGSATLGAATDAQSNRQQPAADLVGIEEVDAESGGVRVRTVVRLCLVLDEVQAALLCVDRFDNRAGKTK